MPDFGQEVATYYAIIFMKTNITSLPTNAKPYAHDVYATTSLDVLQYTASHKLTKIHT
jgi:hypothetical protein